MSEHQKILNELECLKIAYIKLKQSDYYELWHDKAYLVVVNDLVRKLVICEV